MIELLFGVGLLCGLFAILGAIANVMDAAADERAARREDPRYFRVR